ncbi:MAG: hypothetical protein KDB88_01895, partial [Flavobacteriales bacterium]|nr:hypothetical protein [Flavobacteriales bacterium]
LLTYPFLLIAFWDRLRAKQAAVGVRSVAYTAILALPTFLVHPLGWIVLLFAAGFFILLPGPHRRSAGVGAVLSLVWGMLHRLVFPPTAYEAGSYATTMAGISRIDEFWSWESTAFLMDHSYRLTAHYAIAWSLLVMAIALLLSEREFRLAAWSFFGTIGILVLNLMSMHRGDTAMMMEKGMLPLALCTALPIAYVHCSHGNAVRSRWIAFSLMAVVLFLKVRTISFASRSFTGPASDLHELIEAARSGPSDTYLVRAGDRTTLEPSWALAFTSLLASSADQQGRPVMLLPADPEGRLQVDTLSWTPFWYFAIDRQRQKEQFGIEMDLRPNVLRIEHQVNGKR